jgi:hypothetical protein
VDHGIRLTQVHSAPIAVVKLVTTLTAWPSQCLTALGSVYEVIRAGKVQQQGQHVMLYRPLGGDVVAVECGVQIVQKVDDMGPVVCSETPAGEVATLIHLGPYEQLRTGHGVVRDWCARHGHELAGVCWEIYGDWDQDPARRRTDIFHLLKSASSAAAP